MSLTILLLVSYVWMTSLLIHWYVCMTITSTTQHSFPIDRMVNRHPSYHLHLRTTLTPYMQTHIVGNWWVPFIYSHRFSFYKWKFPHEQWKHMDTAASGGKISLPLPSFDAFIVLKWTNLQISFWRSAINNFENLTPNGEMGPYHWFWSK